MKTLPVLIQVYSVRDDAAKDVKATFAAIKEMGYDGLELAGLYDKAPEEIRAAADAVGLPIVSAHVPYAELTADAEGTVAKYEFLGCKYIAIPYMTEEYRPGVANYDEVLAEITRIGQVCKAHGIQLLYHNHDFEFDKMPDGTYGLDYLYSHVPADLLQTELDTCWVNVGGEEPSAYVRKYTDRAPVVHLKDFWMDRDNRPEQLYDLIGIESKQNKRGPGFEFRPVGYGLQDIPAILAAAIDAGASYVVVEQDQSIGRTPMEAIRMSREYLKNQGW